MSVQLPISYETLLKLVEQLPEAQQRDLLIQLQKRVGQRELSAEDKKRLLRAMQIDRPVNEVPSPRREDW